MSLALLAAFKAVDRGRGFSGEAQFTACLLARLISMGESGATGAVAME